MKNRIAWAFLGGVLVAGAVFAAASTRYGQNYARDRAEIDRESRALDADRPNVDVSKQDAVDAFNARLQAKGKLVAMREKPATLVDRAFNFAHYLLDRGPVLKDGDTIGLSAQERFRIRHVPSAADPTRTVYRIEL